MSIPLVQSNNVNDINTSLIAIRRELNNNSGSSSMSDVNVNVDVNYNVADVIESGNSLPVTSNAVADALSYSTTEVNTGKKWIDGKTIYRIVVSGTTSIDGVNVVADLSSYNISEIVLLQQVYEDIYFLQGNYYSSGTNRLRCLIRKSDLNVLIDAYADVYYKVFIEYTKTA